MNARAPGSRPLRRIALLAGLAALALAAYALCVVRVPGGAFGVATGSGGARLLASGRRAVSPFSRVSLYPAGPLEIAGDASLLTAEGASLRLRYRFSVEADPARAADLAPRRLRSAPPAGYAEELRERARETLASASPDPPEARLRHMLEEMGLVVHALEAGAGIAYAAAGDPGPPVRRLRHPILLVGLDGADWQILDPLIAAGKTPTLARLKERSLWGHMRSYEPVLSPLLWTTVATGKSPDQHGVIDFLIRDPATGKQVPTSSRNRKVRALWDIFSERGLSADVVAWWASWPADPIRGRMVSDRVAYSLFDVAGESRNLTWPESLWARLQPGMVSSEAIGHERLSRFVDLTRERHDAIRKQATGEPGESWRDPVAHLAKIVASTETYHRMALQMLREGQADLFAVYYQGIDEVSHRFAHFMPPRLPWVSAADFQAYHRAVESFYEYQDQLLGELLAAASPDSTVLVLSDHGFHNGPSRPTDGPADIEGKPAKWHRLYGIVMLAGEGIARGRLDSASLYDVTPTVLALAGLPVAGDMTGHPLVRRTGEGTGAGRLASYEATPFRPPAAPASGASPSDAADEELMRNLASLGYIGSVGEAGGEDQQDRASAASLGAGPGSVTSYTNLAAVLMRKGDLAGAEQELRRALTLQPGYFPALMTLGQVLVKQGRSQEALAATRDAIARQPSAETGAFVQLALLASRAGQRPQAATFLTALRERVPPSAGIETALGVLAAEAGEGAIAERHYRAALALDPVSPDTMRCLFTLMRSKGREEDLEPLIRSALKVNDRSVLHLNWLGLIRVARGDAAGAEREYRRALELAPDFAGTMANLGALYGRTDRLEEAVRILSRAVRLEPRNLEARINLGAALAKLGRVDELISSLEEARRLGVRSTELLNALGLALAQSGRPDEARERLNESLALAPDQPKVKALLAELAGES